MSISDIIVELDEKLTKANEALDKWEQALTAVMPADFKDWHENSKEEWPDIAALVIKNQRDALAEAHAIQDDLVKQLDSARADLAHANRTIVCFRNFAARS